VVVTTLLVLLEVGIIDVVDEALVVVVEDAELVVVVVLPPDKVATATPAMAMITTIAITAPISLLFMIYGTPAVLYFNLCLNL
jgi:hypothetical protein